MKRVDKVRSVMIERQKGGRFDNEKDVLLSGRPILRFGGPTLAFIFMIQSFLAELFALIPP